MNIFTITGKIALEGRESAEREINQLTKTTQKSTDAMISSFNKVGKAFLTIFAIGKIKNWASQLMSTSASVQAEMAQFEAVFKRVSTSGEVMFDVIDGASQAIQRVTDETGIMANRLRVVGTSAFTMFAGAGLSASESLVEMEKYLRLLADAGAFYDKELEDVQQNMLMFIRGRTQAGASIGLFSSELQRDTVALELYNEKYAKLNQAQRELVMMKIVKDTYDLAGVTGQASREADQYVNVMGNLKRAWQDFQAEIGKPLLTALLPKINALIKGFINLKGKFDDFKAFLEENQPLVEKIKTSITLLTLACATLVGSLGVLAGAEYVINFFKEFDLALNLLFKTLSSNSVIIVTGVISALIILFVRLMNTNEDFRNVVIKCWEDVRDAIQPIAESWGRLLEKLPILLDGVKENINVLLDSLKESFISFFSFLDDNHTLIDDYFHNMIMALSSLLDVITSILDGDTDKLTQAFSKLGEAMGNAFVLGFEFQVGVIKNVFNGILSLAETGLNGAFSGINKVINLINKYPSFNIPNIPTLNIPKLGNPSLVNKEGLAIVGDEGPEIATPVKDIKKIANIIKNEIGNIFDYGSAIENKPGNINDFIKNLFENALSAIENSKIFKQIAKSLGFEIKEEIENNTESSNTIPKLAEDSRNAWQKFFDFIKESYKKYFESNEVFKNWIAGFANEVTKVGNYIQNYIMTLLDAIEGYQEQILENEVNTLENALDEMKELHETQTEEDKERLSEELASLYDKLDKGKISREEYADAVNAISEEMENRESERAEAEAKAEEELLKKEDELARKQFESNKATSIANVWISSSVAVMKALAEMGYIAGAIAGGMILATAGIQTATIASQQYVPALAKGGIVDKATTALIGEDGKEAIVPLSKNLEWVDTLANVIEPTLESKNNDNLIKTISAQISELKESVAEVISRMGMGNQQIVLDGKVVGMAMSPYIDNSLGLMNNRRLRGV